MTATVPEGWSGIRGSTFANLFQLNDDLPTGAIGAWRCRTASSSTPVSPGMMDPPLGPTVDDFVTALAEVPGYTTTEPTDVDLFGYSGTYIEEIGLPSVAQSADGFSHPWNTKLRRDRPV